MAEKIPGSSKREVWLAMVMRPVPLARCMTFWDQASGLITVVEFITLRRSLPRPETRPKVAERPSSPQGGEVIDGSI